MSPRPPSGRFLKMGRMACVMLITPVTFVAYTLLITVCGMLGGWSMPDMKPLFFVVSIYVYTYIYIYIVVTMKDHVRIIHQDIYILKLHRKSFHEPAHFFGRTYIELLDAHLHAVANFGKDLARDVVEPVDSSRRKNQLQILRRCSSEFECGASTDSG
jgi:hypothetical protein